MKLAGKVAIVTGSARGLGEAMARKFASEGAAVVLCDINIDGARHVADDIKKQGGTAIAFRTDVSIKADVQDMVNKTLESVKAIHILVNNAGTTRHASILEMTEEEWNIVLDVDLKSVFLCTQAVLGHMMKQRYGKIINISSMAGRGAPMPPMANYASAKAGVAQLTKVTARAGGPYGINVNAIAPGLINTPLVRERRTKEEVEKMFEVAKAGCLLNRIGDPEDIANLALFLASPDSSFITGQIIHCDGGRTNLMTL